MPFSAKLFVTTFIAVVSLFPAAAQTASKPDKAAAYYNFAMGHLYAELAQAYGHKGEYVNKAIEHYKTAMKLDPSNGYLFEELTDFYIQAGKLRDAVLDAEEMLRQSPSNLDARRILGRIYTRLIGDAQQGKINEKMLRNSIEQYQKITEADPKDIESWLALGRLYRVSGSSVDSEKAYKKAIELEANNEEALTGLAMVYSDVGDTKRAIEMLRLVTERNPSTRTLAALAGSYEQMRDYASAVEVLKRAIELGSDNGGRLKRALAQNLLYADKLEEALKLYNEIAAAEPNDPQVQLRLSEIYRQKRDFAKARAALAKAKALDKDSLEVRYDEVNLLEAEGKTDQATTLLKGMLDETAKKSYSVSEKATRLMLLERLGMLYRGAGHYQQAVAAFREMAAVDETQGARSSMQVVETWRTAKDYKQAQEEADAALKKFPEDRTVKVVHASLLAEMGKVDAGVAEMRALLKGDKDREIWLAIAQLYEKGKRFPEMEKALDTAERLSGSSPEKEAVAFMRGAMYEKMKKYDAAEAEFRKVLQLNPKNAGALNYLGYMLADRNVRLEEAQKLISQALELDPDNGAYLDSLGWAYYRLNKLPEAENLLVQALARIGKDPTVHDHLGDVYFKQGKLREAIGQWQQSLKEWESSPQHDQDPVEVAKIQRKLEDAKVRLARETGSKR